MIIRPATILDSHLLPEIERSSGKLFEQAHGLEWVADDDVQSEERHRDLIANGIALVAELPGYGVAAFLNGEVASGELHIWQMAVHRDQQRQGIGRKLIGAAERLATDLGIDALTLTTFRKVPWNEPYYQGLGFVTLERDELSPRLAAVLHAEVQAGLPAAQRCAMRKGLTAAAPARARP